MKRKFLTLIIHALFYFGVALVPSISYASLNYIEDASGNRSESLRSLIQWTHSRISFNQEIERVAVGQSKTIEVEIIGGKELLVLAKNVGRTTLIVWYLDGTSETFLFSVTEDFSVLRSALKDIHPNIRIELAPDRPALALRGDVPTINFKIAAESAARHYLGAREKSNKTSGNTGSNQAFSDALDMIVATQAQAAKSSFKLNSKHLSSNNKVAVINLIKVQTLPKTMEEKILREINKFKGSNVSIKRIVHGDIDNDNQDSLILDGEVDDQVTLTRILNIAARLFVGNQSKNAFEIKAITDEAGGLLSQRQSNSPSPVNLSGQSTQQKGLNDIRSNIARSKLLSIAGGRILSTISVRNLPQVRVSVQIHEVNKNKMKRWQPNLSLVSNEYDNNGLFALGGIAQFQTSNSSVENAMQILGGSLTNNLQVGGSRMAFDLLFSLMEQEGISKSLSRPTLTVLAGESAEFNVGGEVPIPTAFAPTGIKAGDEVGSNTQGVFSGTTFKSFGITLNVRAMVDEDDNITMDVNPTISTPDSLLTQQIATTTGTNLNSSAFNIRSISTTTRLKDGQPLVLGGLVYNDRSSSDRFTPGVNQVPVLGSLAESYSDAEQMRELVIIVTPTLVREPIQDVEVWSFTNSLELVENALLPPENQITGEKK